MAESTNGSFPPNSALKTLASSTGTMRADPFPPEFPALPAPDLNRLRREYVAGGGWAWYGQVARTLPNAIDDVTSDFGDDLYDRMLYDPQVAAVSTVWKASILESGINLTSAIKSRSDPDYELAAEIADEAAHMIREFDGTLDDVLWNLLDCVMFGNKVAEQTYRLQPAIKDGREILVLDKLKVRPRRSTVFAVDIYMNMVGLLIRVPPNGSPWASTMMFGPDDEPFNLIAPHKFVILTNKPKDNDPRGTSILRPAYSPWWRKQQIVPEYLRYLSQFAGPSLIGYVGPDSTPQPDPNNPSQVVTAEQLMLGALQSLRNGTAAAFPFGAKVDPLIMQGDGAAFLRAIDHCDQQITKAVLTQELATEEGKHMARAAAEVHQDVLDTLIRQGKLALGTQIRNQLFKKWVGYNWGDKATHLAPIVALGRSLTREQPALWGAASQLMGQGYLAPSQMQALDEQIGLPVRDDLELYPVLESPTDAAQQPVTTPAPAPTAQAAPGANPNQPPELPDKAPWQKKIPPPSSTKHKPTVARPALPGMIGVRSHSRKKPGRINVHDVNEASRGSNNSFLPTPSAGAFSDTYDEPTEFRVHMGIDQPEPMRIHFDPIRVESEAKITSDPIHMQIDAPAATPPQQTQQNQVAPMTIRRNLIRDENGRITGLVEHREPMQKDGADS